MTKTLYLLCCVLLVHVSCSSQSAEDLWSKAKKEMDSEVKLELMDRALELEPKRAEWYFDRGAIHEIEVWSVKDMVQKGMRPDDGLAEEHYRKALADFGKTIELKPSYAQAFYQRGLVHFEMGGHIDEACKDWKAALDLGYDAQDMIAKNCP
jgi:tetratricopeptide (TPR) repeat protein